MDNITKDWIKCAADEMAAKNGCRFDMESALFAKGWIEDHCVLYEGEFAGQPLLLRDWQEEFIMRLFGWVRFSKDWNREVRRFRKASVWVPKKNKKSPTLAALGLYLLCGDGEPGQKVYSTAKDGKQAMISHRHAMEMVEKSEILSEDCKINKSTGQITHLPTRSSYIVVSGDNPNSQEGLNGSVLVDETHVVNTKLMEILKGAGISRSEPLHVEVSTAGKNPEGYGKKRFDYGLEVEKGTFIDQELLFMSYAAPQDLNDSDLAADPIKYGKMANPAWGHTIKESEFLSDYNTSKVSLSSLNTFKMYRLNIWQRSENPWLKAGAWEKCYEEFTESDLYGRECVAGLDLAPVRDLCALVYCFPFGPHETKSGEKEYKLLPYFWTRREYAVANNDKVSFLDWESQGFIEVCDRPKIDYERIKQKFRYLSSKFIVKTLVYDIAYAEETVAELKDGEVDKDGAFTHMPLEFKPVIFPQNIITFTNPTMTFEADVDEKRIKHNGHKVLEWNIGNTQIITDKNSNIRPAKPDKDSILKIDGTVAAIMARALANDIDVEVDEYSRRGFITL